MPEKDNSEEHLMSLIGAVTAVYEELGGKVATIEDVERVLELSGSKNVSAVKLQEMCDMMNETRREDGLLKET